MSSGQNSQNNVDPNTGRMPPGFNQNMLMDTLMNGMLISSFTQVTKSDNKMSLDTLACFLLLMLAPDIKNMILEFFKWIKEFIMASPSYCAKFIREKNIIGRIKKWALKLFRLLWHLKWEEINNEDQENSKMIITRNDTNNIDNSVTIDLELTPEAIKSFTHYLLKNAQFEINRQYDVSCTSLAENKVTKTLKNINFTIDNDDNNMNCKILDDFSVTLDQNLLSDGSLKAESSGGITYGLTKEELNDYKSGKNKNISIFVRSIKDKSIADSIAHATQKHLENFRIEYDSDSKFDLCVYKGDSKDRTECITYKENFRQRIDFPAAVFGVFFGNLNSTIGYCSPYEYAYIYRYIKKLFDDIDTAKFSIANNKDTREVLIKKGSTILMCFTQAHYVDTCFNESTWMSSSYAIPESISGEKKDGLLCRFGSTYPVADTTVYNSNVVIDFMTKEKPKKDSVKLTKLKLKIISETMQRDKIFDEFYKHLSTKIIIPIKKIDEIESKHIDVYYLDIKRNKKEVFVPNPEYAKWCENNKQDKRPEIDSKDSDKKEKSSKKSGKKESKKDKKKDTSDDNDDSESDENSDNEKKTSANSDNESFTSYGKGYNHYGKNKYGGYGFIYTPPPQKEVLQIEYELEIKANKVQSTNKSITTLYLRKKQKDRLVGTLTKYRDDKDLYDRLEIPRKLGFLLHGTPGTGKSTTIKAIASFLGKDLYFVNISCLRKNKELKMVFDYIRNNCNNGIIVFEDIDAMTEIVKDRNLDESKYNLSNVIKQEEDELSLSFFLNLLDGTLCGEDTIFVMTTNHKEILDKAVYRKGRVDFDMEMKLCDRYQIAEIYKSIKQKDISHEVLDKMPEDKLTPADILFHIVHNMYDDLDDEELFSEYLTNQKTLRHTDTEEEE